MISPEDTMKIARKYGLKIPRQKIIKNMKEAKEFAKNRYPVVMKISSSGHKTESGGVFTDVTSDSIASVFKKLKKKSKQILIQEQVEGIEAMVGGINDKQFGPCVSFGTGGIFVEILGDVNFRVCPVMKRDAHELVKESFMYRILKGYRGKKYDMNGVLKTITNVSEIMLNEGLSELDINPLICNGRGAWAVDVRMG